MPICVNPKEHRVDIPVGEDTVVLILREFPVEEYQRFINQLYGKRRLNNDPQKRMEARIRFVDDLLIGVEGKDGEGKPKTVTYTHPETGEELELTPDVANWKEYVNPLWKYAVSFCFDSAATQATIN